MATTKPPIIWQNRATRNRVGSRVWPSRCGRYYIVACEIVFGVRMFPVRYALWHRFRGKDRTGFYDSERLIGRYKSKLAAQRAAERVSNGKKS